MLHTKQDFVDCLKTIVSPLKDYYTPGCAGIKCGHTGVSYGEEISRLEGFARVFWGLAPLWGGGHDFEELSKKCLEGIKNGTNPNHAEYWGEINDGSQKMVEAAAFGLALVLAPHKVWEPLTDEEKKNFHAWLWQMNTAVAGDNNWKFFAVLVNLGLKNVGAEYSQEVINHGIDRFEAYYVSNGWYTDGISTARSYRADYYVPFAIHFYSLIYAKVMETEDPETSKRYKDRATIFAKDFIYWFSEDGSALPFGRSLTYRFAQCCFWSACVFAGIEPFPLGVMKGIIARNLEWWMSKPIFDNGGILSVGYAYPNYIMSEFYNAYGSPYWALKAFLILALADDHEFFKVEALPLPKLDALHPIPEAKMVIQRTHDNVVALTSGQWIEWEPPFCAQKYSKFAYSTKYAFSVPRTNIGIARSGADSTLAFDIDGFIFARGRCSENEITKDGIIRSVWSPFRGIEVETHLIPTPDGHIRKHRITSDIDCLAFDCGFATPPGDEGRIEGEGQLCDLTPSPNTNILNPYTKMKALCFEIKKGTTEIETKIVY